MIFAALDLPLTSLKAAQNTYNSESSGPVLHTSHLDALGKAVQSALAPSQVLEVVHITMQSLQDAWARLPGFHSKNDTLRKGNHVENHAISVHTCGASAGLSFSLTVKVACIALPLRTTIKAMAQDVQRIIDDMQITLIHRPLRQVLKIIQKRGSREEWTAQVVAAAMLNLWYILNTSCCLIPRRLDHKNSIRLLDASEDSEIIPELSIEIVRVIPSDGHG